MITTTVRSIFSKQLINDGMLDTFLWSLRILNIRRDGAICKGKVTPATFPGLVTPSEDGGCVRCKCSTCVPS